MWTLRALTDELEILTAEAQVWDGQPEGILSRRSVTQASSLPLHHLALQRRRHGGSVRLARESD